MKSLKRKKKIDKSESTGINKYKFKAQQDALKEGISSYYTRVCEVIDLEKKMKK